MSVDELMADGIVGLHRAIDEHETIPLLKVVDIPMQKRELKRRKRKNPDELDKNTDQLCLFE